MRHVMIVALFFMVCSEIPFGGISYCIETSQLSCVANQLAGFCGMQVFHGGVFEQTICIFGLKFSLYLYFAF